MSPFLRAVEARILREREERVTTTPGSAVVTAPAPRKTLAERKRCDCGGYVLREGMCAGCFAATVRAKGITPRGKQATAVLEVVSASPWGATAADVCSRLGMSQSAAFAALSRGVRRGELRRVEQGRYARATP